MEKKVPARFFKLKIGNGTKWDTGKVEQAWVKWGTISIIFYGRQKDLP